MQGEMDESEPVVRIRREFGPKKREEHREKGRPVKREKVQVQRREARNLNLYDWSQADREDEEDKAFQAEFDIE